MKNLILTLAITAFSFSGFSQENEQTWTSNADQNATLTISQDDTYINGSLTVGDQSYGFSGKKKDNVYYADMTDGNRHLISAVEITMSSENVELVLSDEAGANKHDLPQKFTFSKK